MESIINFDGAGQAWSDVEDFALIKEYTIDKLSILDICQNHKRRPGGITARLKRLNLIAKHEDARGYLEYKKSSLYKKINESWQESRVKKTTVKCQTQAPLEAQSLAVVVTTFPDEANIIECKDPIITVQPPVSKKKEQKVGNTLSDFMQLKADVKEMKENINKILELMNAVYDFESENK